MALTPGTVMADDRASWRGTGLRVADVLWTCFVLTPLTIFYWGGTWKLMDLLVFPDSTFDSSVVSLAVGTTGCLAGYLTLPLFGRCLPPGATAGAVHVAVSRVSVYLLAALVLNYWRGVWQLMDYYVGTKPLTNGICVGASCLVLVCLRSLGNVVSAPFFQELDVRAEIYRPITRFKVQVGGSLLEILGHIKAGGRFAVIKHSLTKMSFTEYAISCRPVANRSVTGCKLWITVLVAEGFWCSRCNLFADHFACAAFWWSQTWCDRNITYMGAVQILCNT